MDNWCDLMKIAIQGIGYDMILFIHSVQDAGEFMIRKRKQQKEWNMRSSVIFTQHLVSNVDEDERIYGSENFRQPRHGLFGRPLPTQSIPRCSYKAQLLT